MCRAVAASGRCFTYDDPYAEYHICRPRSTVDMHDRRRHLPYTISTAIVYLQRKYHEQSGIFFLPPFHSQNRCTTGIYQHPTPPPTTNWIRKYVVNDGTYDSKDESQNKDNLLDATLQHRWNLIGNVPGPALRRRRYARCFTHDDPFAKYHWSNHSVEYLTPTSNMHSTNASIVYLQKKLGGCLLFFLCWKKIAAPPGKGREKEFHSGNITSRKYSTNVPLFNSNTNPIITTIQLTQHCNTQWKQYTWCDTELF